MRTPFENWWQSRPSYKATDKPAAREAWNAAIEYSTKKPSAERTVPLIKEPNNEHPNSRWRDIL